MIQLPATKRPSARTDFTTTKINTKKGKNGNIHKLNECWCRSNCFGHFDHLLCGAPFGDPLIASLFSTSSKFSFARLAEF